MKNPYARTTAATWAKFLMEQRGWTHAQVQAEIERLWDEKGSTYRARLWAKTHNILTMKSIRKKANRSGVDVHGRAVVWWVSDSGKVFSSQVLAVSPL